jgi:hypothetical protein
MARVVAESPDVEPAELLKRIDAAYPFGPRQYHPYKCWLQERKLLQQRLASDGGPLSRPCAACGVAAGKACREYAKRWDIGTHYPLADGFHEARINPPSGPLFGDET